MDSALHNGCPNASIADLESVAESKFDQASVEPWDAWQSWDDTDTYEDPGIPSIEMILLENSERERHIREMTETLDGKASDTNVPLPIPNHSQIGLVSNESSDEDGDDEDDAPKRRGPKRNPTFPNPPHGALPHPILGMELDQAAMQEYMMNYARQEGSAYSRTNYNHGMIIRWRCKHNGKYNNHHDLPVQVTDKRAQKELLESGKFVNKCS